MAKTVTKPSDDNIKFLCGLIHDVAKIDECLDDLNISTTTTFSSLKISQLAQDVKHNLEAYVQSSINGLTHLKKKKVDVLPSNEDAEDNVLYLIKDTSITDDNVYSQYLLIDGVLEPLGTTHTNLDNYYEKSEADLKFALLTDLQTLINAIGSISELKTTVKDTLVNAINEIKDGLDDCIKKDAIVTTLDDTVTNGQLIDGKTIVDKFTSIDNKLSLRYNFDSINYKSYSGRKSAIKSVIKTLKKDGVTTSKIDYYENHPIFVIRYNNGYYFTYIMTSYYSKVFILEFSVYTNIANIWCEDDDGEMYLTGTIPITLNKKHFLNPFTSNTSNYKLYDGYYTISGKTCSVTVSIDCISPVDKPASLGLLADLNLKASSTTTCTVDLKAEDDENNVMRFYVGISECQAWLGTAGKRYTGTFTYRIK